MILTGRCKIDFEAWYIPYIREQREDYNRHSKGVILGKFDAMPLSMKFGVYQDFFLSKNSTIYVVPNWLNNDTIEQFKFDVNDVAYKDYFMVYSEKKIYQEYFNKARIMAIQEVNKLYNENQIKVLICDNCKSFWIAPVNHCECGCKSLFATHKSNYTYAKNYLKR